MLCQIKTVLFLPRRKIHKKNRHKMATRSRAKVLCAKTLRLARKAKTQLKKWPMHLHVDENNAVVFAVVRPARFELTTPGFVDRYSIQLSYERMRF